MPSVKSVDVPSDTYHDSVRVIFHSTLEALQAKYGAVNLTSAENTKPDPLRFADVWSASKAQLLSGKIQVISEVIILVIHPTSG